MAKYIVYYNKEFKVFDTWRDTEEFVEEHEGCRFKKVENKKQEKEIREKWEGLENFVNKIYVAVSGNVIKRFDTWKECEEFLKEYPDAKYKSFIDDDEAQDFINSNARSVVPIDLQDVLYCYLGYFGENNNYYAAGSFLAKKNGKVIEKNSTKIETRGFAPQILGELSACLLAIEYATRIKEERVIIVYSNEGVEMWANGSWSANKKQTIDFKKKIDEYKRRINIDFINAKVLKEEDKKILKDAYKEARRMLQ